jgi:hypothetical protein
MQLSAEWHYARKSIFLQIDLTDWHSSKDERLKEWIYERLVPETVLMKWVF